MITAHTLDHFLDSLRQSPEAPVFNPWNDVDPDHDATGNAPNIRRRQLRQYLWERRARATHLLIAEAVGYQGGHFSGMAMTSERILLGYKNKDGVRPEHVFRELTPERTSRPALKPHGFSENTATIVWKALMQNGIDPYKVILWNTFPWHPYRPEDGLLTNRTPTDEEFLAARPFLRSFLTLFSQCAVVALGRHAAAQVTELGEEPLALRHPAHGGAPKFRQGLRELFADTSVDHRNRK